MSTNQVQSIREAGFYWCRDGKEWIVAEWSGEYWLAPGLQETFSDAVWDEIDPEPVPLKH